MSLKNKKLKFNLQKFSEPITDLTGYTWTPNNVNSINVTSNDIGNYAINYSITCDNSEYNSTGGTSLNIVSTSEYFPPGDNYRNIAYIAINTLNYNFFGGILYSGNGRVYESNYGFVALPTTLHNTGNTSPTYITSITITGGTDATDTSNKFASLLTWLQDNGTLTAPIQSEPISSFNSIKLNNNVLSFNGIKYQLDGTASITDNNNSSFKGISIVDNGDDTATLFVDSNEIIVNYPSSEK